jgi:primosomal replication protein N
MWTGSTLDTMYSSPNTVEGPECTLHNTMPSLTPLFYSLACSNVDGSRLATMYSSPTTVPGSECTLNYFTASMTAQCECECECECVVRVMRHYLQCLQSVHGVLLLQLSLPHNVHRTHLHLQQHTAKPVTTGKP